MNISDELDFLNDYLAKRNLATIAPAPSTPIAPVTAPVAPAPVAQAQPPIAKWATGFPALDQIGKIAIQLFDNPTLGRKGKIQHVLKVSVWDKNADPASLPWNTFVDLIDPTKVVTWAVTNAASNFEIDADRYGRARDSLVGGRGYGSGDWVKMGHIKSPPGKQYFPNEFVTARCTDSAVAVTLHIRGQLIEFDQTYLNKSSNPKSAVVHAWKVFP